MLTLNYKNTNVSFLLAEFVGRTVLICCIIETRDRTFLVTDRFLMGQEPFRTEEVLCVEKDMGGTLSIPDKLQFIRLIFN